MTTLLSRPAAEPDEGRHRAPDPKPRERVAWSRPAVAILLVATAILYIWDLSASGYANTFYAAAAQAGGESWKAWFFGSLDAQNFITVDKPPASLWVTGLSVRLFGMSSWAVLVPQALMGVGSVGLLYLTVRRAITDQRLATAAGLIAGGVLAFTPAAALMFRFNNPDALLVLLMVAGAYCVMRATAAGSGRWLAMAGVALGFAFLTKMLQGLLVLPAFGLVYLLLANTGWVRRVLHLLGAALALVAAAGWWVLAVALWPASARPYIGGSTDNTVMDLVLGYNGLGRIFGASGGGGGQGGAGSSFGGATGLSRLFSSEMGYEISWLLPVALLVIAFGVYLAVRRGPNTLTHNTKAALVLWSGWLVVTALVFSYMSGTIHPYYTVALAPAIAALVGVGGVLAWERRGTAIGRLMLAAMIVAASAWSLVLLDRADFGPVWIRWVMISVAAVSAVAIVVGGRWRKTFATAVLIGSLAGFGGVGTFAIATAATAHSGSIPTAVSSVGDSGMGGGGMGGPGGQGGTRGTPPAGGQAPTGQAGTEQPTGADGGMGGGGDVSANTELTALLEASDATWAAATGGSQSAAQLEIASGTSVMAIGGWSGDPTPTLEEFIAYVQDGKIGYYISGGQGGGGMGGSESSAQQISEWVAANYTATTVGSSTVYKLT
ncbi:glycosyltransferase family 39 protein [Williamsia sp. 1135]|uniref:ArnT family glycosyltransferase n=1 Tax=Williamsia sp. 1135 TaxID=1889262 RepID=UPI000A10EC71|nr:glycosyltransferase family 39 protein [Williamsia sp. 1135]ORM26879.1 glycosyl transferase [Williamsia sp. 1135]